MILERELKRIMEQNALITYAYSRYINHTPRFINADMVEDLARDCECSKHDSYLLLLSAAMGLDTVDDPEHRLLERLYIKSGVRALDPTDYQKDAYYQAVKLPSHVHGRWETLTATYTAYEPFVWRDPIVQKDLREIPQIGYFENDFHFPAIHQDGVEWMSVKPNEVETMKEPIQNSHGRVLTLGLGLGYFAFHASQKEEVSSVTVVERDMEVIELFKRLILPQFPHKEKIEIVCADAIEFMEKELPGRSFDTVFADLWHDASDGLELYLKLRRLERNAKGARVDYWIECSLLSALRHLIYEKICDSAITLPLGTKSGSEILTNDFLRTLSLDFS